MEVIYYLDGNKKERERERVQNEKGKEGFLKKYFSSICLSFFWVTGITLSKHSSFTQKKKIPKMSLLGLSLASSKIVENMQTYMYSLF